MTAFRGLLILMGVVLAVYTALATINEGMGAAIARRSQAPPGWRISTREGSP